MNTRNVVISMLFVIAVAAATTVLVELRPRNANSNASSTTTAPGTTNTTSGQLPPATSMSQGDGPGLARSFGSTLVGHLAGSMTGGLATYSHFAYTNIDNQAYVIDIQNPSLPTPVGFFDTGERFNNLTIAGTYAYVTKGGILFSGAVIKARVDIYSLANPQAPKKVGEFEDQAANAFGFSHVYVTGTMAYITDGDDQVYALDVSDPNRPTRVSVYDAQQQSGAATGITGRGNYLYVAQGGPGIVVVDATNHANLKTVTVINTPGYPESLAISGSTLFVADFEGGGMMSFDISNPAKPRQLGQQYATPNDFGGPRFVRLTNNRVLGISSLGLTVFNIHQPSKLLPLTTIGTDGVPPPSFGAAIQGDYLYTINDTVGMFVFAINGL